MNLLGKIETIQLIDHLDVYPEFAHQGMRGTVQCMAMKKEPLCAKRARQHGDVPEDALSTVYPEYSTFYIRNTVLRKGH